VAESDAHQSTAGEARETGRLEAFSDGVFAIAITLLILQIDVPLHSEHLLRDLLHRWPSFLAYTLSFLVILIMWVNHHTIFRMISRIDRRFLILNGLLLMLITFLNYPTAVVADYLTSSHASTALVLYNGTFVVVALTFATLWFYAAHDGRLLAPEVPPERVAAINRAYRLGPFIYMAAFLMAFVSVPLSLLIDIGLAIFFTVFNV